MASAIVSGPGMLSVSASASVDGIATASASFSYMLEATGGTGQVLVVFDQQLYSGCSELLSDAGSGGCEFPTVLLGGTPALAGSYPSYLATYGVPFSFVADASVEAYALGQYQQYSTETLDMPFSDFVLLEPNAPFYPTAGTLILLPDVPEPGTGLTGALGLALLALGCRRINLRRCHPHLNDDRGHAAL
jgi:MYXO-CTERM domain-containing protein